jgi:hypothetical protein
MELVAVATALPLYISRGVDLATHLAWWPHLLRLVIGGGAGSYAIEGYPNRASHRADGSQKPPWCSNLLGNLAAVLQSTTTVYGPQIAVQPAPSIQALQRQSLGYLYNPNTELAALLVLLQEVVDRKRDFLTGINHSSSELLFLALYNLVKDVNKVTKALRADVALRASFDRILATAPPLIGYRNTATNASPS